MFLGRLVCGCRQSLGVGTLLIHGYLYTYAEIYEIFGPKKGPKSNCKSLVLFVLLKVEWDQWYCEKMKSVCQSCQTVAWTEAFWISMTRRHQRMGREMEEMHAAGHRVESVKLEMYVNNSNGFLPLFLNMKSTLGFLACMSMARLHSHARAGVYYLQFKQKGHQTTASLCKNSNCLSAITSASLSFGFPRSRLRTRHCHMTPRHLVQFVQAANGFK